MSFDMAKRCVDYLVEKSGSRRELEVTFFGGEPLLNFGVMRQVVDYCRQVESERPDKSFRFETITNGVLLTRDKVDYFVENNFALMISLDGSREMNNFNRPSVSGADYYDTIVENATYAASAYRERGQGLPIKIRANLTHTHHDLIGTVRFLESLGFTSVGIAAIDELPWTAGAAEACKESDLDEIEAQHNEMLEVAAGKAIAGKGLSPYERRLLRPVIAAPEPDRAIRGLRCGVGRNTNIVDVDGNIYPCHRYGNLEPFILGNVLDGGLDRSQMMKYYDIVNQANMAKCQTCWARNLCSGMCPWELSRPDGLVQEPHETRCTRLRRGYQANMLMRQRFEREAPQLLQREAGCGPCACPGISSHAD